MKQSSTRQKIVQTASDLFYRNGYNLTGINEIIAEAGIAKATLYSHFSSKEEVCIAYLQHKNETFLQYIREFCAAKSKGKARLLGVIEFLVPFFHDKDFNGCWCIRTVAEIPADNEHIRYEIKQQKTDLIAFIDQLVSDNLPELAESDQQQLARRIYMIYESAVAESHLQQDPWPIHAGIDLLSDLLESISS